MNEKEPNRVTRTVLMTNMEMLNEVLVRYVRISDITYNGESDTDNPQSCFTLKQE